VSRASGRVERAIAAAVERSRGDHNAVLVSSWDARDGRNQPLPAAFGWALFVHERLLTYPGGS
jgi:hypothetical protein